MFENIPEELLWDFLFPMMDNVSLSQLVVSSKNMLKLSRKNNNWWKNRIKKDQLYRSKRPYPEYREQHGLVFLRLSYCKGKNRCCFSCLNKTSCIHNVYNIHVCKECSTTKTPYRMITRSTAMKEYCLKGKEVDELKYSTVPNPHFKNASPMRLYMLIDVIVKKGDRDIESIKAKKEQSLLKRREKKEQLRENRRQTLQDALENVGVEWRDDSELCEMYISSNKTCLELNQVVEEMAFMKYLHNYTDYKCRLEKEVEYLCSMEGYYYQGIWRDASDSVKCKYKAPHTWPWLVSNEKK